MKKTLYVVILSSFVSLFHSLNAQTIAISEPEKGTVFSNGNCISSKGLCNQSMTTISNYSTLERNVGYCTFYKNRDDKIAFKIPKSLIDKDWEVLFLGKDAYFLENEEYLDESIQKALNAKEPLILTRGWHPLIELEDCYIISYTLKQ